MLIVNVWLWFGGSFLFCSTDVERLLLADHRPCELRWLSLIRVMHLSLASYIYPLDSLGV